MKSGSSVGVVKECCLERATVIMFFRARSIGFMKAELSQTGVELFSLSDMIRF